MAVRCNRLLAGPLQVRRFVSVEMWIVVCEDQRVQSVSFADSVVRRAVMIQFYELATSRDAAGDVRWIMSSPEHAWA
jgi:hypothetical protein